LDQHEPAPAMPEAAVIARNLNQLFKEQRQPDGRKYPMEDVAAFVSQAVGEPVSRSWIGKLRDGTITAPDPARLDAVAKFFGKTAADLRGNAPAMADELREIAKMVEDLGAQGLNLRQLHELSPEDLGVIRAVVERLVATHNGRRND
jgi:hypothetical protein